MSLPDRLIVPAGNYHQGSSLKGIKLHYYQFNIGDYHAHTSHLEPLEDLAYRRMMDWYYLNEMPLPADIEEIARLIRMRTHTDCIAVALREFFTLTDGGYIQARIEAELDAYREKSEKARKSAKARWDKSPPKTGDSLDANALRPDCERNAKQEPLTNKQEPLTNNQSTSEANASQASKYKFDESHYQLAMTLAEPVRQRFPKQTVNLELWADTIRKLITIDGYTVEQISYLWNWRTAHQNGSFSWADNCRTPMKLREKKDGLTYFEIIKTQIAGESRKQGDSDIRRQANDYSWAAK